MGGKREGGSRWRGRRRWYRCAGLTEKWLNTEAGQIAKKWCGMRKEGAGNPPSPRPPQPSPEGRGGNGGLPVIKDACGRKRDIRLRRIHSRGRLCHKKRITAG